MVSSTAFSRLADQARVLKQVNTPESDTATAGNTASVQR